MLGFEKKKGKEFLPFSERKIIMSALKNVIDVINFNDSDQTCINGIVKAIEKYPNQNILFANGGDRNHNTTPEGNFCTKNNVKTIWGIGGENKSNSSSWILEKWNKN